MSENKRWINTDRTSMQGVYNSRYSDNTSGEFTIADEDYKSIDRDAYEEDLKRRQKEHLGSLDYSINWQPCLHDGCEQCIGTGIKKDGSLCVHFLSCPCPKCSPR